MKRLDDGKISFVEFMRSIRFNQRKQASRSTECQTHFADFDQQARPARSYNAEDRTLVRSAN